MDKEMQELIKKLGLENVPVDQLKQVLNARLQEIEKIPGLMQKVMSGDTEALKSIQDLVKKPIVEAKNKLPKSLLGKYGNIVKVGATLGAVESMMNGKDDNVFTTAGHAVKDTALVGSAYAAWKIGVPLAKSTTVGSMIQGTIKSLGSDIVDEGIEMARAKKVQRGVGLGFKIYAGIVGVGTVADIGLRLHDHHETKNMEHQQEKNLKKAKKEDEKSYAQTRTDYMDYGQISFDLFNQRSGHHKMGNSKFY